MGKGLLLKTLLFIAESRGSTPEPRLSHSFHCASSKSESPRSEWSSESASSTPPCRSLAYAPRAGNSCDDFSSLSSSSESDQLDADSSDPGDGNMGRVWSHDSDSTRGRGWGDATFAPWLESESASEPGSSAAEEQPYRTSNSAPTDACPVCVRPMSCMETLFAPSCGYLCHLSCMQRTLRNNLDHERGNRPLEINAMRCPICFALHPLAHGVQFSDVRGNRFVQVTPPHGADSPKFLPGELRRVLQPKKAAHTRGYASEADSPKRHPTSSFPVHNLCAPPMRSDNWSPSHNTVMGGPVRSPSHAPSPLSKSGNSLPPRPRLRTLHSAPAQLSGGRLSDGATRAEGYVSSPGGSPRGYVLHSGACTPQEEGHRTPAAEQVSKRLADFYQFTAPPRSVVSRVVSLSSLQRTLSA